MHAVKEQYDVGGISTGQSSAITPPPSNHLTYTTLTSTNFCQIAGWWGQCIPVKMACSSLGMISLFHFLYYPPLTSSISNLTHTHLHKLLSDGRLGAAQTGQKGLLQFGRQFTSGQALIPAAPVQLCQLSVLRSYAASRYPQPVQSASSANAES